MKLLYAHQELTIKELEKVPGIFLAGPTPRDEFGYNWRPYAVRCLHECKFKGNVFLPISSTGDWSYSYDDQIEWELKYLGAAHAILFWVPRNLQSLPGFTTNVEFGMFVRSGKAVLGYPPEAVKMRYLDFIAKKYNVPVYNSCIEATEKTVKIASQNFS